MPELPEVETMRRGIQSVVGGRIERMEFPRSSLKPIAVGPSRAAVRRRVSGRSISRIDRLGKRILIWLGDDLVQVIEPRMTGLMLLGEPPDEKYLRVGWHLSACDSPELWFWDRRGLGTLTLLTSSELQNRLGPSQVGPDALALGENDLRERLRMSRRAVKVALLDQRAIAGIGNLYASEILFVARVHPGKPCCRLTRREWTEIDRAVRHVLTEAVRYEGSTLSDGTYRNALNKTGTYQNHHRVYARAGEPCENCGAPIRRFVQAQRSTFWCGCCQQR